MTPSDQRGTHEDGGNLVNGFYRITVQKNTWSSINLGELAFYALTTSHTGPFDPEMIRWG